MAIDIIGAEGSAEWDAATEFSEMLSTVLRLSDAVTIVAGAKCWGQGKVDVDLVALGSMGKGLLLDSRIMLEEFRGKPAYLSSFALTVEVKDLPPERLQIAGHNKILGEYRGVWSDLSEQAFKQRYAAKGFVEGLGLESPFWYPFLWLRNVAAPPSSSRRTSGSVARRCSSGTTPWSTRAKTGRMTRGTRSGVDAPAAGCDPLTPREPAAQQFPVSD
ncbi:MAG: hypothetical protein ACKVU4_04890 [Phycisphaerales bacterium]